MIRVRVNARFRSRPLTGVERFAGEVVARLGGREGLSLVESAPGTPLGGLKGHAWEQLVLPRHTARGEILFSPCNTGPLSVENQLLVIHDAAVWDCPGGFSPAFRTLYRQLLPRLAKRARAVATVSEFSRTRLAPHLGIPADAIVVFGNAVSPAFSPGETLTKHQDGPVLLCVGSMDPRKNLGRLLRVWLGLHEAGKLPGGARLRLAGGANPRSFSGVDRVEGAGIEWLGRVEDAALIDLYRGADAFIYPSLYEGFGLPPLEAMACGCPVLLSNAASLPEVGGPGSEGAVSYFDPESEEEMASAIERFLALDRGKKEEMRTNALARSRLFSWEAVADRVARRMAEL